MRCLAYLNEVHMIQKICKNCCKPYTGSECETCKKERAKRYNRFERKEERNAVYQSASWNIVRERVLSRDKGLCMMCYSMYKRVNLERVSVHHIIPVEDDSDEWYSPNNLVTLCSHHHAEVHSKYHQGAAEKRRMQSRLRSMIEWEV